MKGLLSGSGGFKSKKRLSLGTPVKTGKENDVGKSSKTKLQATQQHVSNEAILEQERTELAKKVHVKSLYSVIQRQTGSLGGGGAGGAIYGEITLESFQRVIDCLCDKCEFSSNSVFLDIGAGLGKPNFHVAINPGVKLSLGVELIGGRWWQSMLLLKTLLDHKNLGNYANKVFLGHANVTDMKTFDPVTHVYSFNRGFPPEAMESMAQSFHSSKHSKYFICFDKEKTLENYGFNVTLVDVVTTKMAGSGEQHRCFVYRRNDLNNLATQSEAAELFKTHKPSEHGNNLPDSSDNTPINDDSSSAGPSNTAQSDDITHSETAGLLQSPSAKQRQTLSSPTPQRKSQRRLTRQQTRLRRAESLPASTERETEQISTEDTTLTTDSTQPSREVTERLASELRDWKTWAVHPSAGLVATWDLVVPPKQVEYAPHVEHSVTYSSGKHSMLKGMEVYRAWVEEQVGLHRTKRSSRRRSAARHETS